MLTFFFSFVDRKKQKTGQVKSSISFLMAPPLHHDGYPQAAAAPNAYEQEREARIAANRARLVELGIVSSTNASASAATSTMPLGVLSHSSSSGRPSAWARSMFGAGQKVARRRPTVALKVRMFLCWRKENEKNDRREKKKQFHFIDFEREKKKLDLERKLDLTQTNTQL